MSLCFILWVKGSKKRQIGKINALLFVIFAIICYFCKQNSSFDKVSDRYYMKIIHTISNKAWGGGEQTVLDLSRRQLKDGIDVELCCIPMESMVEHFRELSVPIHRMPLRGVLDLKSAWMMAKLLKNSDIDAIHVHNFKEAFSAAYARVIAGRKDIRLVMCRNLTRKGKTSIIYRWLYSQLDCIVFDSQLAMDEFMSTKPPIRRDKLQVIFNAIIVPDDLKAKDLRAEFGIADDETIILCHGRLDPEKGQHILIEAAVLLKGEKFKLVLVGGGSEEYTNYLKSLVQKHQLEGTVMMAGFVDSVMAYVAGGDIGVLPSIVAEGCSLAAQEHMSFGHPIVATNNGGQREYIVDGKNGLLVPPADPDALADALRRLLDDQELCKTLGAQAKSDFDDHLNYESFYHRMSKIY